MALGVFDRAAGYVSGSMAMNTFFFAWIPTLKSKLPAPDDMNALVASKRPSFEIDVDKSLPDCYNAELAELRKTVLACVPRGQVSFATMAAAYFALRVACCVTAALATSPTTTLLLGLLQFVLLPYSCIVSFHHLLVLGLPLFGPHYLAMSLLHLAVPSWASLMLPISTAFIVAMVVMDQAVCWLLCYETPKGKTIAFGRRAMATHVVYGFLNCKTYSVILLLLLSAQGCQINLTIWALDAFAGVTPFIATAIQRLLKMDWATVYYHQHRIAHLPVVYDQSHKFHHYLHDTTPFDAHIYGAGAPEEWFALVLEAGMALRYGQLPAILNYSVMMQSIASKIGHSRSVDSRGGTNHHADHHTLHRKNFGFGSNVIVDMLFETNSNNDSYQVGPYAVNRAVAKGSDRVQFSFKRTGDAEIEGMLEAYRNPSLMQCLKVALEGHHAL